MVWLSSRVSPHTGLLQLIMDLVVGTGEVTDCLSVTLILGEPAVTLEAEGLVAGIVLHVDVAQVPARKYPCGIGIVGTGNMPSLPSQTSTPLSILAVWFWTSSLSSLGLGLLVDEMRGWVRWSLRAPLAQRI